MGARKKRLYFIQKENKRRSDEIRGKFDDEKWLKGRKENIPWIIIVVVKSQLNNFRIIQFIIENDHKWFCIFFIFFIFVSFVVGPVLILIFFIFYFVHHFLFNFINFVSSVLLLLFQQSLFLNSKRFFLNFFFFHSSLSFYFPINFNQMKMRTWLKLSRKKMNRKKNQKKKENY